MTIRGENYCDNCYLHIGLQKHAVVRVRAGDLHFHDREPGDCWEKRKKLQPDLRLRAETSHAVNNPASELKAA